MINAAESAEPPFAWERLMNGARSQAAENPLSTNATSKSLPILPLSITIRKASNAYPRRNQVFPHLYSNASNIYVGAADINENIYVYNLNGITIHAVNVLLELINKIQYDKTVDEENHRLAEDAISDAKFFFDNNIFGLAGQVDMSEEGALSVKLLSGDKEVLIVFSGERIGSFATRDGTGFFSSNITEFYIDQDCPDELKALK